MRRSRSAVTNSMRRPSSTASSSACCSAARRSARSEAAYEKNVTAVSGTTEMAKNASVSRERSVIGATFAR